LSMQIIHTRVQWRISGNMVILYQLNDYQRCKMTMIHGVSLFLTFP
jgi:hypothetical protein